MKKLVVTKKVKKESVGVKIVREEFAEALQFLKPIFSASKAISGAMPVLSNIKITSDSITAFNGTQCMIIESNKEGIPDIVVSGEALLKVINSYTSKIINFEVANDVLLITREGSKNTTQVQIHPPQDFISTDINTFVEEDTREFILTNKFISDLVVSATSLSKDNSFQAQYNTQVMFTKENKYTMYSTDRVKFSRIGTGLGVIAKTINIPRNVIDMVASLFKIYGEGRLYINSNCIIFKMGNVTLVNLNTEVEHMNYEEIINDKFLSNIGTKYNSTEFTEIVKQFTSLTSKDDEISIVMDSSTNAITFTLISKEFKVDESILVDGIEQDLYFTVSNMKDFKEVIDNSDTISFVKSNYLVAIVGLTEDGVKILATRSDEEE